MFTDIYNFLASIIVGLSRLISKGSYILMAIKSMIKASFTVGIGTVLYNFVVRLIDEFFVYILQLLENTFSDSMPNLSYEFVGLGAYLFQCFRLGECLSVVMTAVVLSWLLAFIPFIGKK